MLSPEQQRRLANALADDLRNGSVEVSDGNGSKARTTIETVVIDGNRVTAVGTFGRGDAVFEWRVRTLLASDGSVVDVEEGDFGRKSASSAWTVEAEVTIT